jgi:phage tail protein X
MKPRRAYPESGFAVAEEGDTADRICFRYFGRTGAVTEQLLSLNPRLAALGSLIPHGVRVKLPAPDDLSPAQTETVKLWD